MQHVNLSKPPPPCDGDKMRRPTAAIDRAWRQKDAEGVEQALNDYAREDEQVICLTVQNSRPVSTEFYLEPWAENVTLSPQAKVRVYICEPKQFGPGYGLNHRTHIDISQESIVLCAPTGAMAYVLEVTEGASES